MVAHICNPNTREVEAGGPGVQGEPGLYEILSLKKNFSPELFLFLGWSQECNYFLIHLYI